MKRFMIGLALVASSVACGPGVADTHNDHHAEGEHPHGHAEAEATEHADDHGEPHTEADGEGVVSLTAEAAERSGIRLGKVEERALAGGTSIAAEVQFDATSTAHVGPLVPGRITRVAVTMGERVKRGQVLGVVASSDVRARVRVSIKHVHACWPPRAPCEDRPSSPVKASVRSARWSLRRLKSASYAPRSRGCSGSSPCLAADVRVSCR